MKPLQDYVLVVNPPSKALATQRLAKTLSCPVVTIASPTQALDLAKSAPPYLVILSGDDDQAWSSRIARQIRQQVQPESVLIVALTESSNCSWQPNEDNAGIDGFLVEPISAEVLDTLNESAITQKRCLHPV
ncbi:MAG: hypothetical protein AAFN12_09680 [Cyanobacteria bacterium J06560_2]